MKRFLYISWILLFAYNISAGQNTDPKNKNIINFIEQTERFDFNDTLTIEDIFFLYHRTQARKKYINSLQREVWDLNKAINNLKHYISKLDKELTTTKKIYAQLITFTYINKIYAPSYLAYLLASKSAKQAYIRLKYLEIITTYIKQTAQTISILKLELSNQQQILEKSLKLRKQLIKKINTQSSLWQEDITLLNDIKAHQKQYELLKNEIYQYETTRNLSTDIINKLLDSNTVHSQENLTLSFQSLKGKLPSPINDPIVIIPFGVHEHKALKDIKVRNDGIDITSADDSIVKVVYDGTVIKILTLPNTKYAVVVKHGDFFTVYSNLTGKFVTEGENLKQFDKIGYISLKSTNSSLLNFQIWHLKQKLNPQNWILL